MRARAQQRVPLKELITPFSLRCKIIKVILKSTKIMKQFYTLASRLQAALMPLVQSTSVIVKGFAIVLLFVMLTHYTNAQTQLLSNTSFSSGSSNWTVFANNYWHPTNSGFSAYRTSSGYCWFGNSSGGGVNNASSAFYQWVTVPANTTNLVLGFWYRITTSETSNFKDYFECTINAPNFTTTIYTVTQLWNQNYSSNYAFVSFSIPSGIISQLINYGNVYVVFSASNNSSNPTIWRIDDVSLQATISAGCTNPSGLSVASVTSSSATLNWNYVSSAQYELQYRQGTNSWLPSTPLFISSGNSYTKTGLSPSTQYQFRLRRKCSSSSYSSWIQSATFVTSTASSCNAPTGLTVSNIQPTSALISWNAVTGAQTYTVELQLQYSTTWNQWAVISGTSTTLVGLTPGGYGYFIRVKSYCGNGVYSTYSNTIGFITPNSSSTCNPPYNVHTNSVSANSVTLAWNATGAVTYNYFLRPLSQANFWIWQSQYSNPVTFTGLQPSTQYEFKVSSNCASSTSLQSSSLYFTTPAFRIGESSTTFTDSVQILKEKGAEAALKTPYVFPNPVMCGNTIFVYGIPSIVTIELYSTDNRLIHSSNKNDHIQVPTDISKGVYFIKIIEENGNQSVRKVLIQ